MKKTTAVFCSAKKCQELPMSTIVLLIIVLIAVAVGIGFVFVSFSQSKENAQGYSDIGEQGSEQGISIVEKELFKADCGKKCMIAKAIAKPGNRDDICSWVKLARPKIENSGYCNDKLMIDSTEYRCDNFPEAEQCDLIFQDAIATLTCDDYVETC